MSSSLSVLLPASYHTSCPDSFLSLSSFSKEYGVSEGATALK